MEIEVQTVNTCTPIMLMFSINPPIMETLMTAWQVYEALSYPQILMGDQ